MRLVHFSPDPIIDLRTEVEHRRLDDNGSGMKPSGFWLSDEDENSGMSWSQWSRSEQFRTETHFKYAYEIDLAPGANILFLRTVEDIDQFTEKFVVQMYPSDRSGMHLNWKPTIDAYDGIIITPYQWERRLTLNHSWYYSWDCASGVIWNIDAIQRPIRQIPPPDISDPHEAQIVPDPMLLTDQSDSA